MKTIKLTVNGAPVTASVEPRTQLADFLRDTLNLTGTHLGCEHGVCGACTLNIDGEPARSCITLAVACDGAAITTIEGLNDDEITTALRQAFSQEHALQCGYCTPGMLASARDVALRMPDASEHEIRLAMSGNLCRCTGYVGIVHAIQRVLAARKAQVTTSPTQLRTALGPAGSGHAQPTDAAATSVAVPPAGSINVRATLKQSASTVDLGKPQTSLHQSFSVDHPRQTVWAFFGRLGEVTTCLPGASVLGTPTNDHVDTLLRVKLGPIVAAFEGAADMVRDTASHTGTLRGSAHDARSSSTTRGEIRYALREEKGGLATRVDVDVGFTVTGPLAQFSRAGIAQDIAKRMTTAFAQNLQARLNSEITGEPGAAASAAGDATALDAGSLFISVIRDRIGAFVRWLLGR